MTNRGMRVAKRGMSRLLTMTWKITSRPRQRIREKPYATRLLDRHTPTIVTPAYISVLRMNL